MLPLRIEHLTRIVDSRPVVRDITFEVHSGTITAVVGPSGSGKSSLLRLINRLDEPTGGTVFLNGQDSRSIPPRELRRRVGMVMQRPFLFPGTIAANLRFGPGQRAESLTDEQVETLLSRLDLSGFGSREVDNLSGGEAQRVSIARTLANGPELLLLDEPTAALDEARARDVEVLVSGIVRDRNLACVMVTHNREQARRVADRVVVIENGAVAVEGGAREVIGEFERR